MYAPWWPPETKIKGEKREYKQFLSLKTKREDRITGDEVALRVIVPQVLEADFHVQLTATLFPVLTTLARCRFQDNMSLYIIFGHTLTKQTTVPSG